MIIVKRLEIDLTFLISVIELMQQNVKLDNFLLYKYIVTYFFVTDNTLLCTGSRDNFVKLWDVESGTSVAENNIHRNLVSIFFIYHYQPRYRVMVINSIFNNISFISWQSVLSVEVNRSTRRNPRTCRRSLTNFIT